MVTLYNYSCPEKLKKDAKPHGENPPSRKDKEQNLKYVFNMSLSSLEWVEWTASSEILWWRNHELQDHALECRINKNEEERLLARVQNEELVTMWLKILVTTSS